MDKDGGMNALRVGSAEVLTCGVTYGVFLALGAAGFADYGVSWDEPSHIHYSFGILRDFFLHGEPLPYDERLFYGRFFDLLSWLIISGLGITDSRSILQAKHFLTFAYFAVAVIFFHHLCKRYFRQWVPAYIATLFLILHPRIFADSFYNPKDLPFLCSFVIAVWTMWWFCSRPSALRGAVHGVACGMCTGIRIFGMYVPMLTVLFMAAILLRMPPRERPVRESVLGLILMIGAAAGTTIVVWPYLWEDPIGNFLHALDVMRKFSFWDGRELYWGEWISGKELIAGSAHMPRHYLPVWIVITTPPAVTAAAIVGTAALPWLYRRACAEDPASAPLVFLPYLWFWIPFPAAVVGGSVLYNGWRQMYFLYPPMAMIAAAGLLWAWNRLAAPELRRVGTLLRGGLVAVVSLDLLLTVLFLVRNHPYQYVYFSPVIGGIRGASGSFDRDYWGVSFRRLLEKIVARHGKSEKIVVVGNWPVKANWAMLRPEDRRRVDCRVNDGEAAPPLTGLTGYYQTTDDAGVIAAWKREGADVLTVEVDGVPLAGGRWVKGAGP